MRSVNKFSPPKHPTPTPLYWLYRTAIYGILWLPLKLILGLRIRGRENWDGLNGGAVIVCNHIHHLDCVMVHMAAPWRRIWSLSLPSNLALPVAGSIIRTMGALAVPGDAAGYMRLYRHLDKAFARNQLLLVYPEGSRKNWYPELREFHPGAFRFARKFDVPVVPFVFRQYRRRGLFKRGLELIVTPPLEVPPELKPKDAAVWLENAAREAMESAMSPADCEDIIHV